jgi:hypothetical protein
MPLARDELDKGSTSRWPRGARGHDSTRGYACTKVVLGSGLDDVHARTSRGRKRRVLCMLAGSDLELASWCAAVARGSTGHSDGLENLDGGLAEDSTGHSASMIGGVGGGG